MMLTKKTNDADVIGYCSIRFPVTDLKKSIDFYCNVLVPRSFFVTNSTGHVTMIELLTKDLLALHERIKQAGAHIDNEPVFTNEFGYFTFYDPDGHYIRAVEERGVFFDLQQRMSSTLKFEVIESE